MRRHLSASAREHAGSRKNERALPTLSPPPCSLLFGKIVNSLNSPDLSSSIQELCLQMMGIAIAAGVSAYLQFALANVSAVRQVRALRSAYVQALLRQDLAWCDAHPPGELAARLTEDTVALEDAIGGKFSLISQSIATFLAGVVLAFSLSWKMSLVLLGFIPVLGAWRGGRGGVHRSCST